MSAEISVTTPNIEFEVRYHKITVYAEYGFLVCHGAGQPDTKFKTSPALLFEQREANFYIT